MEWSKVNPPHSASKSRVRPKGRNSRRRDPNSPVRVGTPIRVSRVSPNPKSIEVNERNSPVARKSPRHSTKNRSNRRPCTPSRETRPRSNRRHEPRPAYPNLLAPVPLVTTTPVPPYSPLSLLTEVAPTLSFLLVVSPLIKRHSPTNPLAEVAKVLLSLVLTKCEMPM